MYYKLQQIAEISSGYTFRGPIENDQKGDLLVLQAKNISANKNIVGAFDLVKISSKKIRAPYFLEYNDILLVSRTSSSGFFRTTIFSSDQKNIIASSSVSIIRIKDVNVLPKYVSLYLNSIAGQRLILSIASGGSYIQNILIKDLSELSIPVPSIHAQKNIIALHENIELQEKILERKSDLKKIIINALFTNLTK